MLGDVVFALLVVTLLFLSVKVVGKHERVGIMRLGRFAGVRGPGVVWVLPFLDTVTRVNLDREIQGWQSLSAEELAGEIQRRLTT